MSCHVSYQEISHSCSKTFYFSSVSGKIRYFLFHLPQCLYLFHFDGRDILEASRSLIL